MIEILTNNHFERITEIFDEAEDSIYIISPFLNRKMSEYLCKLVSDKKIKCTFVTRLYLQAFLDKANSIDAIENMLLTGIDVYSVNGLHSKLYIVDEKKAVIGSANFTTGGFSTNIELSLLLDEKEIVSEVVKYNNRIIEKAKVNNRGMVTNDIIFEARQEYDKMLNKVSKSIYSNKMYGADIGLLDHVDLTDVDEIKKEISDNHTDIVFNCFEDNKRELKKTNYNIWIKFVGVGYDRTDNNNVESLPEVKVSNKTLYTVNSRRNMPRIADGDLVYLASLSSDKQGTDQPIIVGRGFLRGYNQESNEANEEWIKKHPWMKHYKHYCIVDNCQILNTPIKNGITLYSIIYELLSDTYMSSFGKNETFEIVKKKHHQKGIMQLTPNAQELIDERFDRLSQKYGVIEYISE